MITKIIDHLARQISSGRWLVTMAASIVFVYTSCKGMLDPSDVKMIIGIIVTFYFTKSVEVENGTK